MNMSIKVACLRKSIQRKTQRDREGERARETEREKKKEDPRRLLKRPQKTPLSPKKLIILVSSMLMAFMFYVEEVHKSGPVHLQTLLGESLFSIFISENEATVRRHEEKAADRHSDGFSWPAASCAEVRPAHITPQRTVMKASVRERATHVPLLTFQVLFGILADISDQTTLILIF